MKTKIEVLQAGRAIAALAVLLSHTSLGVTAFVAPLPPIMSSIFGHGYLGVDFFFVLSGYIIFTIHGEDARTPQAASRYLEKRIIRIFVPYLPVSLALIALYLAMPGVSAVDRNWSWLTSLTLIPSGHPPALSVAWTLVHEMLFYFIFLGFYATRKFYLALWVWATAIVIFMIWPIHFVPTIPSAILKTLLAPINLEFLFGITAAVVVKQFRPLPIPFLICGFLMASVALTFPAENIRVAFGSGMALLTIGLVQMERAGKLGIPASLVLLGNASYAIYLVHNPLVSVLARLPFHGFRSLAVLVIVAGGVGAGLAYHLMFERRAVGAVRSMLRLGRPAISTV